MNKSRTIAPVVAFIGLAGAIGFGVLYRRVDSENASLRAAAERLTRLEAEMEATRRDVRGLSKMAMLNLTGVAPDEDHAARRPEGDAPARSVPPMPPAPTRESDQQRLADEQSQKQTELEELNRAVAAERRDPAWARAAESEVRGALQDPALVGSSVTSIDCRSKTCRVEVVHGTPLDQAEFSTRFAMLVPSLSSGTYLRTERPDGKVATVAFMATGGEAP